VVQIGGRQYRVRKNQKVVVDRLPALENEEVRFDSVKMVIEGDKIRVGSRVLKEVHVIGKVLRHFRADKVIVFKKKRRKGYRVKRGHRQPLSEVQIVDINL